MLINAVWGRRVGAWALLLAACWLSDARASAELDRSRYMTPDEIRPGMKGYGRTVMSGTRVDRFEFEVVSVMSNAYYPKQDVILVRCSGLKLEHSGIIGGMSGSPCFITGPDGKDRMVGAVAYGWTFNKDPLCGLQPISQMLPIAEVRNPAKRPKPPATAPAMASAGSYGLGELLARGMGKPAPAHSVYSIFNDEITQYLSQQPPVKAPTGMVPLKTPVMISGANPQALSCLSDIFDRLQMEPVASGGASAATREALADVQLEPGSVLCVPLITGDMVADALGTCTEARDGLILGFGHSMEAQGSIELPLATGFVHTVVPSVMRSNKLGASLRTVGTLWGDESSGIYGTVGASPASIPVDVEVEDVRGVTRYHYNVAQDEEMTPSLLTTVVIESIYAHNEPPKLHTIKYSVDTEFAGLGSFKTANVVSQEGVFGLTMALMMPTSTLMGSPFGEAKVARATAHVKIEPQARAAELERAILDRVAYKPGERVNIHVRWAHYRDNPVYTDDTYSFDLPKNLADGDYQLTLCPSRTHLALLRIEKPHLFRVENLPELLKRLNDISAQQDNLLYMRLTTPRGGVAIKDVEMPDLPSYMTRIYAETRRPDIQPFRETLVKKLELPFTVNGNVTLTVNVNRRADQ